MKHIMISAGEVSGDLHAANLIKSLKEKRADIEVSGTGGVRLEEAGCKLIYNLVDIAEIGFSEIVKHYSIYKKVFNEFVAQAKLQKPDLVILVDFPGFNMRLAREMKKLSIPVVYYISPQVWAWGKGRIEKIKKLVTKMIVFFKFEEDLYKKHGVNAEFVGHPFLDIVKPGGTLQKNPDQTTVALLPGSRKTEIRRHLPTMLKAAALIKKRISNANFLIAKAPELGIDVYQPYLDQNNPDYQVIDNATYDCVNVSDLVIVSSGSATLETAILEKPMVVIYKLSWLSYFLLKKLVSIKNFAMVNVVAGKTIVPELLQNQASPEAIAKEALNIISSDEKQNQIKISLQELKNSLGEKGASVRAAEIISGLIDQL